VALLPTGFFLQSLQYMGVTVAASHRTVALVWAATLAAAFFAAGVLYGLVYKASIRRRQPSVKFYVRSEPRGLRFGRHVDVPQEEKATQCDGPGGHP
jgi:hypothetical protein